MINAVAIWIAAWIVNGIDLHGDGFGDKALTGILVALVFGVTNFLVKPLVQLFSLPLFVLTLGLFTFVVNSLMLWLTSWASGLVNLDFHVDGFWPALLGSLVISAVAWVLHLVLPDGD